VTWVLDSLKAKCTKSLFIYSYLVFILLFLFFCIGFFR
jgi:hypothetical protein